MTKRYRPPVVKSEGGTGTKGPAELTWSDTKLTIRFGDDNGGEVYKVLIDDLPEESQAWSHMDEAYVTMKGNNDEVMGIRPLKGIFTARFEQIARKSEDEPPAPSTYKGKFGPYTAFTVLNKIVKGKFTGAIFPYFLTYKFAEYEDVVGIVGSGNSAARLSDYLDAAGAWDQGELEYEDNILPELEKRMKKAHRSFQIIVKDGFIESVTEADFESDEDEEEEKPRRKPAEEEEEEEAPKSKKSYADDDDEPKSKKSRRDDL